MTTGGHDFYQFVYKFLDVFEGARALVSNSWQRYWKTRTNRPRGRGNSDEEVVEREW